MIPTSVTVCLALILQFRGGVFGEDGPGDLQLSHEKKLKDVLFKSYDKHVRPVFHHRNETLVAMEVIPRYILDLDEERSVLNLDGWLIMHWNDPRLAWNVSDYDGLYLLNLPDNYIWQPDIVLYNGLSSKVDPKTNTHLVVTSTGDVWYVPPCEFNTMCSTDPDNTYPSEIVACKILLGSWSHDGWQINLTLWDEALYLEDFKNVNPRWELLTHQSNVTRKVIKYECCEEPYITVLVTLMLKRRLPAELQVVWPPCVLVILLTLIMFWIPPGSGKKIILGTALFLVLNLLTIYVGLATKAPRGSALAVSFLHSTMYAVVSAVILEILVINLSSLAGPFRPPNIVTRFLSGPVGKFIGVWPRWNENVPGDRIQLKEDVEQVESHPTPKDEWILFAMAIDRVLFAIYIIILATIHQI